MLFYHLKFLSFESFLVKKIFRKTHSYTYSQQFGEFIIQEIKKGPQHLIESQKSVKK